MTQQGPGRVAGKVALVTGGAMGLGKADCEALAREGATVIVTDREVELAHHVATSIGGDAMALDVTREDQWAEADAQRSRTPRRAGYPCQQRGQCDL
ncbi:MAG: SDR family NAD(P)-dependent oxidoreductase [Erythrobacter sp.]